MTRFPLELNHCSLNFPDPHQALDHPNGLLAFGGDLTVERLLASYYRGIFPWYSEGEPILWWSPDPRAVIRPTELHLSAKMHKLIRQQRYRITLNHAFAEVIAACAAPRHQESGTWITPEMQYAYRALHRHNRAHSIEVWRDNQLVGGLYGISVGRLFCGESMFHRESNTSKLAFAALAAHFGHAGGELIDCQLPTPHLQRLGVYTVSRDDFLTRVKELRDQPTQPDCWDPQTILLCMK